MILAPSLLAADFGNLQQAIEMVNASEADWFHIDIMDGVFVPNISYGMPVLSVIQKHATKPLDVHLMIVDPDRYISTLQTWQRYPHRTLRGLYTPASHFASH